jgi:hypothetical protein
MKPWKDWSDNELADEAQTSTRGQGAVVEATRRLRQSVERFSTASTWLAAAMILLGLVQIAIVLKQ